MMNEWIISSSILIGLLLLGRLMLRGKISLRLQYALWAVVLVRLLLPVQIFTSEFGTGSIAWEVDIATPVQQFYVAVNEDRYEREYDSAYQTVVAEYETANRHPDSVDPVVIEQAAQELACDEGALARLGEGARGDYGRTLIGLTCPSPVNDLLLTSTTMTGSAGSIRERIKLLMARPRNTVLTVTAVILMVTLIVGCTFAGAPETSGPTEPGTGSSAAAQDDPTIPENPTETTPGVDNDMSYQGQELPIPDDLTGTELTYVLPMEQAMADCADKNPRELAALELEEFQKAFSTLDENGNVNPAACFLLPYYADISEMDGNEFLAYFPTDQGATEEEFELLKKKYPDFFEGWTWETMPIPIHRYSAKEIEAVVSRYGNIHWVELSQGVHYLEETGCYYNYTSDFGLGGFYAKGGFVYDGGAVVYSAFSALFLTETAGSYTIRAHLPVQMTE